MATFVMQTLGCEVTALNTVNFSKESRDREGWGCNCAKGWSLIDCVLIGNHTAYKQVKGRKTPAEEISELYVGLRQSYLDTFDVMLSGYCPSAEVVREVGKIARELRLKTTTKPGSFFWSE